MLSSYYWFPQTCVLCVSVSTNILVLTMKDPSYRNGEQSVSERRGWAVVEDGDWSRYLRRFDATMENQDWCGVIVCVGPFRAAWMWKAHGIWGDSGGRRCLGRTSRGVTGVLEEMRRPRYPCALNFLDSFWIFAFWILRGLGMTGGKIGTSAIAWGKS